MKRTLLCLLLLEAGACGEYEAKSMNFSKKSGPVAIYSGDLQSCLARQQVLETREGSQVKWTITKTTPEGETVPVSGIISANGYLDVLDKDISTAKSEFRFEASSLDSENALRDERIKQYVLGLSQGMALRFTLDSFEQASGTLGNGASLWFSARGVLEMAGLKASMNIPLVFREEQGVYTVSPQERIGLKLNSQEENGIDLSGPVAQILTFVPGVSLQDTIYLDFAIEMVDACE